MRPFILLGAALFLAASATASTDSGHCDSKPFTLKKPTTAAPKPAPVAKPAPKPPAPAKVAKAEPRKTYELGCKQPKG